jgi:Tir chaperone protein (CesT) family
MPMLLPPEHYDWFDSLCRSLGIVDPKEAIKSGGLQFEGDVIIAVDTSLTKNATGTLLFQSPLGWISESSEALMRRLLEIQFLVAGPMAPTFGLAPQSDLLTVSVAIRPAEVDGSAAADVVRGLVFLVRKLRAELAVAPDRGTTESEKTRKT